MTFILKKANFDLAFLCCQLVVEFSVGMRASVIGIVQIAFFSLVAAGGIRVSQTYPFLFTSTSNIVN